MVEKKDFLVNDAGRLDSPDENTPAVAYEDGYQAFYRDGRLHRTVGPAVIHGDGHTEHWVDGKFVPAKLFRSLNEAGTDWDSDEGKRKVSLKARLSSPQPQ